MSNIRPRTEHTAKNPGNTGNTDSEKNPIKGKRVQTSKSVDAKREKLTSRDEPKKTTLNNRKVEQHNVWDVQTEKGQKIEDVKIGAKATVPASVDQLVVIEVNGVLDLTKATGLEKAKIAYIGSEGTITVGPHVKELEVSNLEGKIDLSGVKGLEELTIHYMSKNTRIEVPPCVKSLYVGVVTGTLDLSKAAGLTKKSCKVDEVMGNGYVQDRMEGGPLNPTIFKVYTPGNIWTPNWKPAHVYPDWL